jgi:3-hydroxy-9,10-secoandrosta-1,3,5(10)-triene-9,17-dione monooxygenase
MTTVRTPTEPLTKADLVERTRALLPAIAERAAAAEQTRRLPDETIDDFIRTGFFRVMVPKRYNGLELDVSAVTAVGRLLGRVCASSGWVIPWLGWHNRGLSMFPKSVQDDVFARGFGFTAGSTTLTGQARRVAGGYRVSGRWSWGTAILHADFASLGAVVPEDNNRPITILPRKSDLILHDNWFTEGMCATGSVDMELRDAFVPAERTLDLAEVAAGKAPGQLINTGPLYHSPTRPISSLVATASGIGIAEGAVDNYRDRLDGRVLAYSGGKLSRDEQSQRIRLASVSADVKTAGMLFDAAVDLTARSNRGEIEITMLQRAEVRFWAAHAIQIARHAVMEIVAGSGARSHFLDDPLQRGMRDLNTLSGHVVFDHDRAADVYGRVALGMELDPAAIGV